MAEAAGTGTAAAGTGGTASGAAAAAGAGNGGAGDPWHKGVDADLIGTWQNKGWDITDPAKLAIEVGKAHREAERMVGVPASQLLKLPAKPDDEAGWKAVYERLGAPKEAKEYDFSSIKYGDGSELEPTFIEALRSSFAKTHLPKDAAIEVTKAVVKYLNDADATEQTAHTTRLAEEKLTLERNWGPAFHANMQHADEAARRLGLQAADVNAIGEKIGVAKFAEMLRRIGVGTTEATFKEGGGAPGHPASIDAATARLTDLTADLGNKPTSSWTEAEKRELRQLQARITGVNEAHELALMGVR